MKEINTSGHYGGKPLAPHVPEETLRIAELRAQTCDTCEHAKSVTRSKASFHIFAVNCDRCGCGNRSLINNKCPVGKHDDIE